MSISREAGRPGPGRPFCIGVTGGVGAGKSSVAELFSALGAAVIDTDRIARDLTRPGGAAIPALLAAFGADVIDAEGALDRARMRRAAFADAAARQRLESILHPLIRAESERRLAAVARDSPYALLLVPLLVETGAYRDLVDRVLVVDCDEEQQVQRASRRAGVSEADVRAIMRAQAGREARLSAADDVIDNRGGPESLRTQVSMLDERYRAMARARAEGVA